MLSKYQIAGAVILCVALGLFLFTQSQKVQEPLTPVSTDGFGGSYTLTNHLGEGVTDKDFSDQYQLIYFGFTYCPAICPTELAKMATALDALGDQADQIQPLFITVDPERDTASVMKGYVEHFHPRLVGLTGSLEQIEHVKKLYKVYAAKVDDPSFTEYTVDHSSYIYFIDPEGRLLSLFKMQDSAKKVEETIKHWLDNPLSPLGRGLG